MSARKLSVYESLIKNDKDKACSACTEAFEVFESKEPTNEVRAETKLALTMPYMKKEDKVGLRW